MGQQKAKIISGEPEKTVLPSAKKEEESEETKKTEEVKKIQKAKKVRSKRYLRIKNLISKSHQPLLDVKEAVNILKNSVKTANNDSFELHIALNLKPKENLKLKYDKNLVIHTKIGKLSEKTDRIVKNINNIINKISLCKPAGKKSFIKSIAICTTFSPSVKIKIGE